MEYTVDSTLTFIDGDSFELRIYLNAFEDSNHSRLLYACDAEYLLTDTVVYVGTNFNNLRRSLVAVPKEVELEFARLRWLEVEKITNLDKLSAKNKALVHHRKNLAEQFEKAKAALESFDMQNPGLTLE